MEYLIKKSDGQTKSIELYSRVFDVKYNESLLHQLVLYCSSKNHLRTKAQKSRADVRGGGIKPWKQKGSGRARVGSIRSPLWRGGGKIFAYQGLVNNNIKINKKMYNLGIRVILSELIRSGRLVIIDNIYLDNIKTKVFLNVINYLNINSMSLFIIDEITNNIDCSTRNLDYINVLCWKKINPLNLMKFKKIYMTESAVNFIQEVYK